MIFLLRHTRSKPMEPGIANKICYRRWGERPREPKIPVGTVRRAVRIWEAELPPDGPAV
jgi:hypothetical protein